MSRSRGRRGRADRGARRRRVVRARGACAGDRHHRTNGKSTSPAWLPPWRAPRTPRPRRGHLGTPRSICSISRARPLRTRTVELSAGTTTSLNLVGAVVLNVTADHMDRYATVLDLCARQGADLCEGGNGGAERRRPARHGDGRDGDPRGGASRDRRPCSAAGRDLLHAAHRCGLLLLREGARTFLCRHGAAVFEMKRMKIAVSTTPPMPWPRWHWRRRRPALAAMLEALETFPGCRTVLPGSPTSAARVMWTIPREPMWAPRSPPSWGSRTAGGHRGRFVEGAGLRAARGGVQGQGPARRTDREGCRGGRAGARRRRELGTRGLDAGCSGRGARAAQPGDTVLLSPACASFDMSATRSSRRCVRRGGARFGGNCAIGGGMNATTMATASGRASGCRSRGTA